MTVRTRNTAFTVGRFALALLLAGASFELLAALAEAERPWPPSQSGLLERARASGGGELLASAWARQVPGLSPGLEKLKLALHAEPDRAERLLVARRALQDLDGARREESLLLLAGLSSRARRMEFTRRLRPLVTGSSISPVALGEALSDLARARQLDRAVSRGTPSVLDSFGDELLVWLTSGD